MKGLFLVLLAVPFSLIAMEPKQLTNIYAPTHVGNIKLLQRDESFYVSDDNATYKVKQHDIDKTLKKLAKLGALEKFKDAGYIKINKHDGSYSLDAKVRGEGGGPALACAVLLGTQVAGFCGLIGGAMAANALLPGGGTVAVGIALGSGGLPGAIAAIEMTSITWSAWALALPTP